MSVCTAKCENCDLIRLIPLSYVIPTFILYILLARLIVKHKEFHSIFYAQFFVIAVNNCLLWIAEAALERIPDFTVLCPFLWENFNKPNQWFFAFKFIFLYSPHLQSTTSVVLVFNRLTAICFPVTIHNIWTTHRKHIFAAQFLVPLLCAAHAIPWPTMIHSFGRVHRGLVVKYVPLWPYLPLGVINSIIGGINVAVIFIGTTFTFYKIYTANIRTQNGKQIEYNLFLTAFFLSLSTILLCVYQIFIFTSSQASYRSFYFWLLKNRGVILDLYTLAPAWIFFVLQKRIRYRLLLSCMYKSRAPISALSITR